MRSLKGFLERRLPRAYGTLQLSWYKYGLQRAFARIMARQGLVVQSGPFQGMKYVPEVATRDRLISHGLLPKLLGCYEQELHGEIAALRRNRYTRIVNIGCAEGYYAVGLARLTADVPVLAFDLDPMARQLCAEMARVNGVADRVTIAAECTSEDLEKLASERALVICDCEGCERTLLCPAVVPSLRTCDLIVELHDCVDPSISRIVPDRFVASHEITLIRRTERDMSAYPAIRRMSPYRQHLAITEFRWGPILWGLFRSRMPPG